MHRYDAPWSKLLTIMTALASLVLIVVGFLLARNLGPAGASIAMTAPFVLIAVAAAFMVRGYEIRSGRLLIHRLGWSTTIDLTGLTAARHDANLLRGSIRLFGNGGFFAFTGWFRNNQLGVYRCFGTDFHRAVVLQFEGRQAVVVTPEHPDAFIRELNDHLARV